MIKDKIIQALQDKKIFIGYSQLCRYLNNKGYKRYGCNAGYLLGKTKGKNRLNPCKVLCTQSKIYHSKVRYWCLQLKDKGIINLEKVKYLDSKNPNSNTIAHKTYDIFILITLKNDK